MKCSRLTFSLGLFLLTGALVAMEPSSGRSVTAAEVGPAAPPYAEANNPESDWYYSGRWYDEYHGYPIHDAYGYDYQSNHQTNDQADNEINSEINSETNNETSSETNNETSNETNNETSSETSSEIGNQADVQTDSGKGYEYDCDYEYDYWQDKYTNPENHADADQILEADVDESKEGTDANTSEVEAVKEDSVNTPYDYTGGYEAHNYGKYGYDYYGYEYGQNEDRSYTDPQIDASEPVTEPKPVAKPVTEAVAERTDDLSDTRYDDGYYDNSHEGREYDAYLEDEYDYARSYDSESTPAETVTEAVKEQTDDLSDTRYGDGYYDEYGNYAYLEGKYDYYEGRNPENTPAEAVTEAVTVSPTEQTDDLSDTRYDSGYHDGYEYDGYPAGEFDYSKGHGKYGDNYTDRDDSEYDSESDDNTEYMEEYEGYETSEESGNAGISDEDPSDDLSARSGEYGEYGEDDEYDYYYCEYGPDDDADAANQRLTEQKTNDTKSVMGETRYMDEVDPFTWMPSDLLQPADKELLRTLNALFEEPGSARELVLDEYIEGLGLDAAEFVARFEEAFGGRALTLHDDLPGVAALLAAYRMVEQGELGMDEGVDTLQGSFNSLSPEWIEDVSFIVTELPDNRGVRTERDLRDEDGRVLQAFLAVSTRSVGSVGLGLSAVFSDLTTLPGRILAFGDAARLSDFGTAAIRNWTAR